MKWLNKTVWGFGLTSFFNDFSHEMTTAILPAYIQQLIGTHFTPSALGLIGGISNGAATGMKLIAGLMADRFRNYKLFLTIGYTITPLFVGLIGTAQSIWHILLYKTVAWMGRGMREPIRDTWLSQIVPSSMYGHVFGFARALDTLGAIAGPVVAFFMISQFSLKTIFFISFIPGLLSIVSLITLTSEPAHYETHRRTVVSKLQDIYQLPPHFLKFTFCMLIFGLAHFHKTLLIFRAQEFLTGETSSSLMATGSAILLYIFFNVTRSIGEFSLGLLSDYTNRKQLLALTGFGLFTITCIGLIISPDALTWWLLIFACAGISNGAVTVLEKAYVADLLPETHRALGYGTIQAIDGFAELASGVIVGMLWSIFNPVIAFGYAAFLSCIAMLLLLNLNTHYH